MKTKAFLTKAICASALVLSSSISLHAQPPQPDADILASPNMLQRPVEDDSVSQLIIKYRDDRLSSAAEAAAADQMARLSTQAGVALTYFRLMSGDAHVLRLPARMPVAEVERIAAQLAALPEVEYAEPDYIMRTLQVRVFPNDPLFWQQWHYVGPIGIRLPLAWGITTGSSSTVVAVIDTGHSQHTDLHNRFIGGYDFVSDIWRANDGDGRDPIPLDPGDWCFDHEESSWHGTHVAGTIGANTNNGIGVAGVNWNTRMLSVRVLGRCGRGALSDVIDGMRWAAGLSVPAVPRNSFPAKVLNMSLGGSSPTCPTSLQSAITQINIAGSIIVVAAGNENRDASSVFPANCEGVITVGATNRVGARAPYSNYGNHVDVSAPGGGYVNMVLSTVNLGVQRPLFSNGDGYAQRPGTSMAAPHVAGVVSLMVGLRPCMTPAQAEFILRATARPFHCDVGLGRCSVGLVDAYRALLATQSLPSC